MSEIISSRLTILREKLHEADLSGLILRKPTLIYHLTGWLPPGWADVFVVVGTDDLLLVTPFVPDSSDLFWDDALVYDSFALNEQVPATENAVIAVKQALEKAGLQGGVVGAILENLSGIYALELAEYVSLKDAGGVVAGVTAIKDKAAQQAIRERVVYLDQAFAVARDTIRPGISETEVIGRIYTSLVKAYGGLVDLACNFGSGPRALIDEPQPTNRVIKAGEVVMIDLYPQIGPYVADYTRNFVVGSPTDAQMAQHAALEMALKAGEAMLKPGVEASEIDQVCRQVLIEQGFGEHAYQHHSGHAFGLAIPEEPWLIPADHTPLQAGMVIAVEPAIYHPENGGMRLEGNYIITEEGCEALVGFPAELIICE